MLRLLLFVCICGCGAMVWLARPILPFFIDAYIDGLFVIVIAICISSIIVSLNARRQ